MKTITISKNINAGLKVVTVYYPHNNTNSPALFDTVNKKVLNFDVNPDLNNVRPFHPLSGERRSVQTIVDSGLVEGVTVIGLDCWHCHDNVFRMGNKPV